MVFVACGLNHKTAPINVREQVALSAVTQELLISNLLKLPEVDEVFVLSTCNRTEIYCKTNAPQQVIECFTQIHNLNSTCLTSYLYVHQEENAIKHALRVAIGLDSMMIGEPQILGQMKQAYHQACQLGAIKNELRSIFEYVFSASKRIRSQSGIGVNPVSIAYAAVQLVGQFFSKYQQLNVLLIGSGETATLVAKYLHQQGVSRFIVANRTLEKAQQLVNNFGGEAISISNLAQYLPKADVIVTATTCPIPFINRSLVEHVLPQRHNAPMFFLDLAVPRDIEENISDLEEVQLYNVDDLQILIDNGLQERKQAAQRAEELINSEMIKYSTQQRTLKAKQVICDYRIQMQHLAHKEVQRALNKLSAGHCQHLVLNEFSERLVNKLTHNPTEGLKRIARDGKEDLLTLTHYLFNPTLDHYEEIS